VDDPDDPDVDDPDVDDPDVDDPDVDDPDVDGLAAHDPDARRARDPRAVSA
jgi:hypothetical protein